MTVPLSQYLVPTRKEALRAVQFLRYTKNLDYSFAREFEVMLCSFGWRTRVKEVQSMKDAKLFLSYCYRQLSFRHAHIIAFSPPIPDLADPILPDIRYLMVQTEGYRLRGSQL